MSTPDDFNELEAMLGDLPMRQPSQMLDERVAATLSSSSANGAGHAQVTRRRALAWASAAAVILVAGVVAAVMLVLSHAHPDTGPIAEDNAEESMAMSPDVNQADPTMPAIQPVNLVWSRDASDQLRYTPSGKPYRAVVRELIDQRVWVDPDTGAAMQATTPRQALYIVEQPVY